MNLINTQATFTRPADTTAYTANDLVANSVTAGSVVPMTFSLPRNAGVKLYRASVSVNSAVPTNLKFNLHLYGSLPTCTNGDNGAWLTTSSNWLGSVAIDGTTQTFSDNSVGWSTLTTYPLLLVSKTVYGLLQATAAYTPTSGEIFTVTLTGESYV